MIYLIYTEAFGYELEMYTNKEAAHENAVLLSEKRAYLGEEVQVKEISPGNFVRALSSFTATTLSWVTNA